MMLGEPSIFLHIAGEKPVGAASELLDVFTSSSFSIGKTVPASQYAYQDSKQPMLNRYRRSVCSLFRTAWTRTIWLHSAGFVMRFTASNVKLRSNIRLSTPASSAWSRASPVKVASPLASLTATNGENQSIHVSSR